MSFLLIFFILSTSLSCKKENIQIISDQEELNNIINSFEEYIYENDHSSLALKISKTLKCKVEDLFKLP